MANYVMYEVPLGNLPCMISMYWFLTPPSYEYDRNNRNIVLEIHEIIKKIFKGTGSITYVVNTENHGFW